MAKVFIVIPIGWEYNDSDYDKVPGPPLKAFLCPSKAQVEAERLTEEEKQKQRDAGWNPGEGPWHEVMELELDG